MAQAQGRTLGTVLSENFDLLDVYGPLEMFGSIGPEVRLVTIAQKAGAVSSTQGPQTAAQDNFENCPPLDLILLPGGLGSVPGVKNEASLTFLRQRSARAEIAMSVCSGSALLAKAGVLNGRCATSNTQFFSFAARQSDKVHWLEKARRVEDGKVATSSGVSAGIDMARALIARLYGQDRAEQIAALTEYEWHQESTWDPFVKDLNQGEVSQIPPPPAATS
jgi:transcriptional regulator GlxA family with amidase domain